MTTGLNDLLGSPRRRPGRPTKEEAADRRAESERELQEKIAEGVRQAEERRAASDMPHYTEFRKPVGVTFLANIVGKQPRQIQKRLEQCPVKTWGEHRGQQVPLYDFMEAIAFLIPPKGNIEDWFAQQNAASLPPYVNKMWWDSASQRNRVMLSSNDLWHTDDVMMVFGRVAMTIRQNAKMWIEDLPERELLNDKQYAGLVDAVNRMVEDVRQALEELPSETLSMTAHIASELEAGGKMPDDNPQPEPDED